MRNPRLPWLFLFITINIIACFIIYESGLLLGDLENFPLHSQPDLFIATFLVVISYLIIMGFLFSYFSGFKIKKIMVSSEDAVIGNRIGSILLVLQFLFFIFNTVNGINVAGSNNTKTDSSFSMLWVLIPVDSLFIIYYGFYRNSKYFIPNLLIWLISNVVRGWSGVFIFIAFLEWCRAVRLRKVNFTLVSFFGVLIIAIYPLIQNLKWITRASAGADLDFETISSGFTLFFEGSDYWTLLGHGISQIIGRLQCVGLVAEVMHISALLQQQFAIGDFAPFWKEGLHGIIYDRLFQGDKQLFIGVAFTKYIDFGYNYSIGDWNVSLGYPSWFFIAPFFIPVYITYTLIICFLSIYILRKIGDNPLSLDMLWLVWLLYLMAPWFLTFTTFIYSLFLFLIIKIYISKLN